ncbi:M48 family metalloprotease [Hydromonas duriensis]|uniref:M48 family metalloprotease n=1 Tax=Hydromonas duriensis TaxID=1527608 RepID=UPI0013C336D1|nr:M48 family metalloprotease [Hydromonas duriensis]
MSKKYVSTAILGLALLSATPSFAFDFGKAFEAVSDVASAATLSDADVKAYASQMALAYDKQNSIAAPSSAYGKRLSKLIKGWERTDGLTLNFKVYNDKEVNAFAMADGTVRINSGLLDMMTDDEVRFVLGHEIGHVKLGHSKSQLTKALLTSAAIKGASSAGGTVGQLADSDLSGLMSKVLDAQFSQADEKSADMYGLNLMRSKSVNPQAAISSLEKLASLGSSGGLMSSHPSSQKRADILRKELAK